MAGAPSKADAVVPVLGRQPIRIQLVILVLVASLPIFLVSIWHLLQERERDRALTLERVQVLLDGTADRIADQLANYAATLALIARQPTVRSMVRGECDPLIAQYVKLHPEFTTIGTRDLQGNPICSLMRQPQAAADMVASEWFGAAAAAEGFRVSDIFIAPISRRWVTVLSVPIMRDANIPVGLVALPLDLQALKQLVLHEASAGPGMPIMVLDRRMRTVLHSGQFPDAVGASAKQAFAALDSAMLRQSRGVLTLTDPQGARQSVAYRQVGAAGWTVLAWTPEAALFAQGDQVLLRSAVISAAWFALALALAWWLSRGITRPLRAIAQTTARVAAGDMEARVALDGGVPEIVSLARAFNHLVQGRNQVELALRQNEESLDITLQSIGDAVIATDMRGHITRMNPAAERITGWSSVQASGRALTEVFQVVDVASGAVATNPVQTVLQTGAVVALANDAELTARDGTRHQIADSAAPIRNRAGEVVGVVLVFSDVSAQYLAQKELREAFAFVRQVIDNLPIGLNVMDAQGRFLEWNPAMESITGAKRAQMLGRLVADAYPREPSHEYDEVMDACARALRGELVERTDRPVPGRRRAIWTTVRHAPVRNAHGGVVGSMAIMQDVTARRLVENALRDSQESLAITLRSIGDAVIATDSSGRITRMNPTAERFTGWTLEEANGRPLLEVFRIVHAVTREVPLDPVALVLASGQVQGLANHTTLIARDGTERQIADSAAPIRDPAGLIVGVVLVFSDVTEQYRLQQVLVESEARYRALVQSSPIGVFVHQQHKVVFVNPAAMRMVGAADETQVLGRDILAFVDPAQHALIAQRARQVQGGQTDFAAHEWRYLRLDGSTLDVQAQSSVIQLHGQAAVQVSIIDITERNRARERLRENEARFRALTSLSSDWYWEQDAQFRFVRSASGPMPLEQPGDFRFEQLEEDGLRRWDLPDTLLSQAQWDQHRSVLAAHQEFRDFELPIQRPDGEVRWAAISGMPIFDVQGRFQGYRGVGRDITAHKQAQEQINALAFYDALTELPNRRLLIEQLKRALLTHARNHQYAALLFIDLDNFKTLNDTLGHETGDQLLQQVAKRLLGCVREADSVARLGGDEFVVMLQGLSADALDAATDAEQVGYKILAAFTPAFVLAGREYRSTPSIGVTLFGNGTQGVEDLLKQADLAMYQAKAAGRNTLRMFDQGMQAAVDARVALESDLRAALVQAQFVLHYQPVVGKGGLIRGAEALVRWRHPMRGQVSPAQFIPLAESTGLIVPLGLWVLDTACAQLAAWGKRPETRHLSMAVNVSAHQFMAPDFVAQVFNAIEFHGADPGRLKLELTESLLADNVEDVIQKMTALRARDVDFSLDDFGTGYSSLSYLKRLPLAHLKIDQSFVRDLLVDPNDEAIARTIVALGVSLGLAVIAEGVETEGQLALLQRMGCETFQGYLFAPPLPLTAFEALLPGPLPARG